jgi:hypothetical protein
MALPRVRVRILEADYDAFCELLPNEENLPPNYWEWLRRNLKANKSIIGLGGTINEVDVTPVGFTAYCETTGERPSYSVLEAHAADKSTKG